MLAITILVNPYNCNLAEGFLSLLCHQTFDPPVRFKVKFVIYPLHLLSVNFLLLVSCLLYQSLSLSHLALSLTHSFLFSTQGVPNMENPFNPYLSFIYTALIYTFTMGGPGLFLSISLPKEAFPQVMILLVNIKIPPILWSFIIWAF